MTREEAMQILTEHKNEYFHTSRIENAIDTAIEALSAESETLNHEKVRITDTDSVEKVQSEQVTSKLKNPCDSLLTDDKDDSKEQKSKLDLISRADAVAYPLGFDHYDKENGSREFICGVESYREYIQHLPSVKATENKYDCDLISREKAIESAEVHCTTDGAYGYMDIKSIVDMLESLPSVSAERSGEWEYEIMVMPLSNHTKDSYRCSVCHTHWDCETNYCPNCGARMENKK